MNSLPSITLVTPSFNQGRFIEATLRSVLDQNYPRLQYIVMDGGSTDDSVEIIRRYEHRLHHWQTGRDGGQGAAIVQGWKLGTGDLIGWLNSDDVLLPGALHAIASRYARQYQIYYGDDVAIDAAGRVTHYAAKAWLPDWFFRHGLIQTGQPGTLFDRHLVERVGYFDTTLQCAMEYDLMLRMFAAGGRARLVRRPLAALRHYPDTKTNRLTAVFEREKREVFGRIVPFPFNDASRREAGLQVMRVLNLLRYASPFNAPRIITKVGVRFSQPNLDEFVRLPFDLMPK